MVEASVMMNRERGGLLTKFNDFCGVSIYGENSDI